MASPAELYCHLMEEIKFRFDFIDFACRNPSLLSPQFTKEACFLQLRMIYELVAIACIAIHSDHVNIDQLERQWSANEIMPRLERLNPEFFPRAIVVNRNPGGVPDLSDNVVQPMDKGSLLKAYGRCGDQLHRGTLKKILASLPASPISFEEIEKAIAAQKGFC